MSLTGLPDHSQKVHKCNPFSITFEIEVAIPVEIGFSSMRTVGFYPNTNDAVMTEQLDFLEENREIAFIWLVDYQQKLSWSITEMWPKELFVGDLVLRRVLGSIRESGLGKLASKLEGPY